MLRSLHKSILFWNLSSMHQTKTNTKTNKKTLQAQVFYHGLKKWHCYKSWFQPILFFYFVLFPNNPAHIARNILESIFKFFPNVTDEAHLFQTPCLTRDSHELRALNGTNILYHLVTAKCQVKNNCRAGHHWVMFLKFILSTIARPKLVSYYAFTFLANCYNNHFLEVSLVRI